MSASRKLLWALGIFVAAVGLIAAIMSIFGLVVRGPDPSDPDEASEVEGSGEEVGGVEEVGGEPQFEAFDILFVYKGCAGEGSQTICEFLVENKGESTLMLIGGATSAYDLEGMYGLESVRLGDSIARVDGPENFASFSLEGRVTHKCSLAFERVQGDIQKIKWSFAKLPPGRYDMLSDVDVEEFANYELFPSK